MVMIPVYFDLNGIHQIAIFKETEDGTFRRTTEQPIRLLRDNITGIGPACGALVSSPFEREMRCWKTPTVLYQNRPYSYYHFLREQLKKRRIFVFSRSSLNGHLSRFDMHELQLKASVSQQVQGLLSRKVVEAIELDIHHETALLENNGTIVA